MDIVTSIKKYLTDHLPKTKGLSKNTFLAYRDTMKLFINFLQAHFSKKCSEIEVSEIDPEVIISFLEYLENERENCIKTRNNRLATLKSFAKMILLYYPEHKQTADRILNIPKKRAQKKLVEALYPHEVKHIFSEVDLKKNTGFRDISILKLLYDSGARASEIAQLNIENIDFNNNMIQILGKGNCFRVVYINPDTTKVIENYIKNCRPTPDPIYKAHLFINKRGKALTRHGIYKLCKKHIQKALPNKKMQGINPVHTFRHSCAVRMLIEGASITDIKNHLGHVNLKSTMIYLEIDISKKRQIQENYNINAISNIETNPELDELINWKEKDKLMEWFDSL
ncbi:integrase family protein [Candidatus Magnetomorum sp. HK-1]|nr:integrase family protein [Candidatus Magnetomorum sp. HK-1]